MLLLNSINLLLATVLLISLNFNMLWPFILHLRRTSFKLQIVCLGGW